MSSTKIEIIKAEYGPATVDSYLTDVCIAKTLGQLVYTREHANNMRAYTVASMVFNAIFEQDIDLIKTIVRRVDGLVPDEDKRGGYANILGDALEDVLSYESKEQMVLTPDDPVIIGIAKVLVYKSTAMVGSNQMLRRERNSAAEMILERVGGRKTGPTKPLLDKQYIKPAWMLGGEDDGEGDTGVV